MQARSRRRVPGTRSAQPQDPVSGAIKPNPWGLPRTDARIGGVGLRLRIPPAWRSLAASRGWVSPADAPRSPGPRRNPWECRSAGSQRDEQAQAGIDGAAFSLR